VSALPATMPPALAVEDLHKSFGDHHVLRGVSLAAREHEVVAILGSSGSGKSTLLRCCNLLEVPDAGRIFVGGEEIRLVEKRGHRVPQDARQVERVRSRLAMVFQQFNLWPHLTVLQNVTEAPVHVLKLPRREAVERIRPNCPADSSSASPSPARWRWTRSRCCSTSRPRRSIRK
jgi:ABC-type histidine transport system ATPase subunit